METRKYLIRIAVIVLAVWFVLIGCPVVTEEKKDDDKKESSDDGDNGSTSTTPTSSFVWAKRLGYINNDQGRSVTRDSSNNIIVTGYVTGNADLNGDGDVADTGEFGYGNTDIFISKFDASGTFLWSKRLGGANEDCGYSITTDTSDNIIVTGYVWGNADLNGDGDFLDVDENAAGFGVPDIFISKFSSEGSFQWAKRLGGTNSDVGYCVLTDSSNNIIIIGSVIGTADLNGDGDFLDGGENAAGYGNYDIVIIKFSYTGNYWWSKRLGGTNSDEGFGITKDSSNNIIVTGYVTGNADLNGDGDSTDGGAESSTGYGNNDIFISKFSTNTSGAFLWSKRLGGANNDQGNSITTDISNNIIVTGYVTGNADLNGDGDYNDSGEDATGYGNNDIFICKFDSSGIYSWSKRLGGTNIDSGEQVATDSSNNIIIIGGIFNSADLNGDGDMTDQKEAGSFGYDVFICKFNSDGLFQWPKRLGGFNHDYGYGITIDGSDNIIVTGYVNGDADLNGDGDRTDGGAESSTGYGNNDIFISKFTK